MLLFRMPIVEKVKDFSLTLRQFPAALLLSGEGTYTKKVLTHFENVAQGYCVARPLSSVL